VCTFGSAPQPGSLSISIPATSGPDFATRRVHAQQSAAQSGGQFKDFEGIGDQAFATSQRASAALLFIKGGRYVQIIIFGTASVADPLTAIEILGKAAAARF